MNQTTKRFARTTNEAFPGSEPWSIYGPYKSYEMSDLGVVVAAVAVIALIVLGVI
jgi:hypothetical protein